MATAFFRGGELIEQMRLEEQHGFERTATERVHGVLEAFGIRGFANLYAQKFLEAQLTTNPVANIAALNKNAAENLRKILNEAIKKESKISDEDHNAELEGLKNNPLLKSRLDIIIADEENFRAFATTFSKVFPKGIEITAQDVPMLMGHFVQLPFLVPRNQLPSPSAAGERQI